MANPDLIKYWQENNNLSREEIYAQLRKVGWPDSEILSSEQEVMASAVSTTAIDSGMGGISGTNDIPGPLALLKASAALYKKRWKTLIAVLLAPFCVVILVVVGLLGLSFLLGLVGGLFGTIGSLIFTIGLIILIPVIFMLLIWSQAALIRAIADSEEGIGFKEAYRRTKSKIFSYAWANALAGLAIIGGFILFVIPGIFVLVWLRFSGLIVVIDGDARGLSAILKSKEYVRGYWKKVFWRIFIFGLIVTIPAFILNLIPIVNFVAGPVFGFIVAPLGVIYSYLLFSSIKQAKGPFEFAPSRKAKLGFGILALLGTIILPVILAVSVLSSLDISKTRARDARRVSDVSNFQLLAEIYYERKGFYPSSLNDLKTEKLIIGEIPTDPKTKIPYMYTSQSDKQNYTICATFETEHQATATHKGENCYNKESGYK